MTQSPDPNRAPDADRPFVSRAGRKLNHALRAFHLDPTDLICADLGSHVGGFVDCLLQRGAARIYAVDTAKGLLHWTLRKNPRVHPLERTSALDLTLPEPVDLVTVDVGWTRQQLVLPRAAELLKPDARIISLIKPHYEADRALLKNGTLPDDRARDVLRGTLDRIAALGFLVAGTVESPITGHGGNREWLALITPA